MDAAARGICEMAPSTSRRSVSSSLGSEPGVAELREHLKTLVRASPRVGTKKAARDIHKELHAGHCVRQSLIESSTAGHIRDAFRHVNGFQAIITATEDVSQSFNFRQSKVEETHALLDLLQTILGVLTAALQDHKGNQKYFRHRVDGGGWKTLKKSLEPLLACVEAEDSAISEATVERLFGCLLSCASNDELLVGFFGKLRRRIGGSQTHHDSPTRLEVASQNASFPSDGIPPSQGSDIDPAASIARDFVDREIHQSTFVHNPEAIAIMLELWNTVGNAISTMNLSRDHPTGPVSLGVPSILIRLTALSTHNLLALHGSGLLSIVLSYLLQASSTAASISELRDLAVALLNLGVTNLDDAHLLFRNASTSPLIADLLLTALKVSHSPPYVHFDLSLHGFASIELPSMGQDFPPLSSTAGYTLSLWIYVVCYDSNAHTTLFGAFDSTQTCFVLAYLEKDTHNLILQTSVTSSRPSVRFKSTAFQPSRWYHVSIVHRRPKTTSSSRASLFINGEFVEQVKSHYPASPPSNSASTEKSGSLPSSRRSNSVQAFLGTPQDLASRLGRGLISSQWRLASAHLFGEALSDDLIAVHHQLGPRYSGNYQDCLGSFQTYQASAALNLRNESLHPGKEEKSDIVTAIRSKASCLLPESKILLNISPIAVLDDDDHNNIDETQLIKSLSKPATKNLRNITRGGRNALAINGSIPSINEALLHPFGFAVLTGDPAVVIPQSLDDAAWRVGGCAAVGLALFEAAHTSDAIVRALRVLFESVQESWRNSEAMERDNGFGVLANLLAAKLSPGNIRIANGDWSPVIGHGDNRNHELLCLDILALILKFVGYRKENPEDSVIDNPLAYRVLLVDFDLWRSAAPSVQILYYEQFAAFGIHSKYHQFNTKRLSRMRIVKKWLDALKGEPFTSDTFDHFMRAFKSMLTSNISGESLRALSLYITYAVHKPKQKVPQSVRHARSVKQQTDGSSRRATILTASPSPLRSQDGEKELTRLQIAIKVMGMYTDLLCEREDVTNIKKFARIVTNKWLLHLLADDEATVVILAAKILARLLVVNGSNYVKKFAEKTGGIIIMQHRLKRWWNIPTIWPICFAILFGRDIATVNLERKFDLYSLLESFAPESQVKVMYPEMLPVLTAMLQSGLKAIARDQKDPDSPLAEGMNGTSHIPDESLAPTKDFQRQSMSLNMEFTSSDTMKSHDQRLSESASILHTVTRFLADVHTKSQLFRECAVTSNYVQELLFVLYPIVVSSDVVSPETELHSRDSALSFNGSDVIIRPLSQASMKGTSVVRKTSAEPVPSLKSIRTQQPKRMSSYILVSSDQTQNGPSSSRLQPTLTLSKESKMSMSISSSIVEELLEIIMAVFSDQIFTRKDFLGLGLFMKVPPGFQEHQAYFESFVLRNSLSHLGNTIKLNQKLLWEPRVLTNLARFAGHLGESLYEGWFINGAEAILNFLAGILEYVQLPDVQNIKNIRLCSHIISTISSVLLRVVLLRLSELDESMPGTETISFLDKLAYWQTVLLSTENAYEPFLKLLCYLLYIRLVSDYEPVRLAAANLWRMLLVQKFSEISSILQGALPKDNSHIAEGFKKLMELDNESFLGWVDENREGLDGIFFGALSKAWEAFVAEENSKTEDISKARVEKRKEKLRLWIAGNFTNDDILRRHEISSDHWRSNIYASEHLKRQRALQDQQDNQNFNGSIWVKMSRGLRRTCGLFDECSSPKWHLDQTEGRNRMRIRLIPDDNAKVHDYRPKRKQSQGPMRHRSSLGSRSATASKDKQRVPNVSQPLMATKEMVDLSTAEAANSSEIFEDVIDQEEDFEMVDDPRDDVDDYEDKNRKVMRSLQRGDQVEHVHNVSRVIGLEACEGLLILGKFYLYLLDNLFQRSDGEIVNASQAPPEERDPYLQMISGREAGDQGSSSINTGHETRSWRWDGVLSISKRRFLFRDVAVEVFFVDGRSYLLTANTPQFRDELYQKLLAKAPNAGDRTSVSFEDSWRIDSIRNPDENPQTLGSRFTSVFAQNFSNPATRKWMKGGISNFHYLMLINTMAGRTFNDLTQYPVFPWVLADYTSDELDLSDPRSFRDLTKPMGCQTPEREAEFISRYQSFAEMGDHNAPPFHYGTHYSSAMIVTSYLIRLQPFVQSYLLLQGGSFDHPDRLFYSVEKTWSSASNENMTDVRELIPEFYYLPEFLLNSNKYDFGSRQGDGGRIDTVALPPWAKGDPKIFIAKHREALESEHVSRNLHHWIDLVFGQKQRGEAALEATNVFHHLSYHGAKDLETINDPVERLATIGIIHNFGQTPHQVFQRAHPQREDSKHKPKRLDSIAESLTRLPFPLLESHDRVASLTYSLKHDRLLSSGGFRLNIGPAFDKYMEWGFVDGGVRFYAADTKKLIGLFEHVHQGQLSYAIFADSKTLITAGTDCTISVWTVISTAKAVDLQPKVCFFGHRSSIAMLAVSRSFSALLSASSDGQVLLWDLNRLELVRKLPLGERVECARINDVTGVIMLGRGHYVSLFTLNGELILEQNVCIEGDDAVLSCAFYEGSGNEYLERDLIFTGHRRGVVNVWNKAIRHGAFVLEHVKRMHHLDQAGFNVSAAMTCVLPMAQTVYTGDEDGRVYEWDCIQRHDGR